MKTANIITIDDITQYHDVVYNAANDATDTSRQAIENALAQLMELGFITETTTGQFQLTTLGQVFSVIAGLFYNYQQVSNVIGLGQFPSNLPVRTAGKVAARRKGWTSR